MKRKEEEEVEEEEEEGQILQRQRQRQPTSVLLYLHRLLCAAPLPRRRSCPARSCVSKF